MKISEAEVAYVAKLAHLELRPDETLQFTSQLSHILDHIAALSEVSTGTATPMSQVVESPATVLSTPLREDVCGPSFSMNQALSNAPERGEQYFKVPKVIAGR